MSLPLAGKRIVITRPPHQADAFAEQLRALGAVPVLLPMLEIEALPGTDTLDNALAGTYDWVIFTSMNAVEAVVGRLQALQRLAGWSPQIACVGTSTAAQVEKYGLRVACIPPEHHAEGLLVALTTLTPLRGRRVLLPQGNLATPYLREELHQAGAVVTAVLAYRTVRPTLEKALVLPPCDALTFTSPSSVQHFMQLVEQPFNLSAAVQVAVLGKQTAQAAQTAGLPIHARAEPQSLEGLLKALCNLFQRTPSS